MPDPVVTPAPVGQPAAPVTPAPVTPPAETTPTWRDNLPDDLKGDKSLATISDIPHLARQYVEAQKYNVGALRMPGANAKPEEIDAFHAKLGRPASPEGYTINTPALPEGIEWDTKLETDFRGVAHRLGLTPTQVQGLVDFEGRRTLGAIQARTSGAEATVTALREEMGAGFERNLEVAGRAVRWAGGDDLVAVLNRTGAGNEPAVIKAFVKLGLTLVEDGAISGDVEGILGPEDAKRQANEIMADPKGPYWNRKDPRHEEVFARVQELFALAFPKT